MYPPRKEAEAVKPPPVNEVRYYAVFGFVALCLAALAKFGSGTGSVFLIQAIGAWLNAVMIKVGLKSRTRTFIACGLAVVAAAVYFVTRHKDQR